MPGLTDTDGLTDVQRDILSAVREFTEAEIIPAATELDHSDTYPDQIVAGLVDLGGWISISGIINTHFIVA
jgi:alkylation response protein AidB-like acyl-CoA dehydrogenase